jgi:hypothetical protein
MAALHYTPFPTTGRTACPFAIVAAPTADLAAMARRARMSDVLIQGGLNAGETSALVARCVR